MPHIIYIRHVIFELVFPQSLVLLLLLSNDNINSLFIAFRPPLTCVTEYPKLIKTPDSNLKETAFQIKFFFLGRSL